MKLFIFAMLFLSIACNSTLQEIIVRKFPQLIQIDAVQNHIYRINITLQEYYFLTVNMYEGLENYKNNISFAEWFNQENSTNLIIQFVSNYTGPIYIDHYFDAFVNQTLNETLKYLPFIMSLEVNGEWVRTFNDISLRIGEMKNNLLYFVQSTYSCIMKLDLKLPRLPIESFNVIDPTQNGSLSAIFDHLGQIIQNLSSQTGYFVEVVLNQTQNYSSLQQFISTILTSLLMRCQNFCEGKQFATGPSLEESEVCFCEQKFIWDEVEKECEIECSQIQNTLSSNCGSACCGCVEGYEWNQQLRECAQKQNSKTAVIIASVLGSVGGVVGLALTGMAIKMSSAAQTVATQGLAQGLKFQHLFEYFQKKTHLLDLFILFLNIVLIVFVIQLIKKQKCSCLMLNNIIRLFYGQFSF